MILDNASNPSLFTGKENIETNRFLYIMNSPRYKSASGIKAGGLLIAENFNYASPSKNDLIVKGNVGIGTPDTKGLELGVKGRIAAEEVKIAKHENWPDFVFESTYNLPSLTEVENHIQTKGHLKNIPSAKEVEKDGFFLGNMDAKLLQKIEELTLYTIQQEKKLTTLQKENKQLKTINKQLLEIQKRLDRLENKN
ncbi:protein of unknown function [Tenacibaculum sp. 190524A02b]|uniref:hypothetical protein n=1 Tax=Tenacibaculum vairaonense TaxID=3137860 RepID=UPI0032B2E9A2